MTYLKDFINKDTLIGISPNMSFKDWMHAWYIYHPISSVKPKRGIELYPYQVKIAEQFEAGNSLVLAGRQMGLTTLSSGFAYWYCLTHPNSLVHLIRNRSYRNVIVNNIRLQDSLSQFSVHKFESQEYCEFVNGSRIMMTTKEHVCYSRPDLIVADEAFDYKNVSSMKQYLIQYLNYGTRVILCGAPSIPNYRREDSLFDLKDHSQMTFSMWPCYFNPQFTKESISSLISYMGQDHFEYSYGLMTKNVI